MNNYQLECSFKTLADKNFTLRVRGVKNSLDSTTVAGVMDDLVKEKLFGKSDTITEKISAKVIETKVTPLF